MVTVPRHLAEVFILEMDIESHLVHSGNNPQSKMLSQLVTVEIGTHYHGEP